jgi:hypothetical protein
MGWTFMQEHLGGFLVELLAAVVGAWIFTAWYPSISDYRAHRSARAAERKIAELEKSLCRYETDFADVKLFVARIMRITTSTILTGVVAMSTMTTSLIVESSQSLMCQIQPQQCEEIVYLPLVSSLFAVSNKWFVHTGLLILTVTTMYFAFSVGRRFRFELSPAAYRVYMTNRINRLLARQPQQAANTKAEASGSPPALMSLDGHVARSRQVYPPPPSGRDHGVARRDDDGTPYANLTPDTPYSST